MQKNGIVTAIAALTIQHKEGAVMIDMKGMQKNAMFANTALMGFVLLAMVFFKLCGVTYMVYHSIPTLAMYVLFFYLIRKQMLYQYVRLLYIVITIYMGAANICVGYNAGFHLYCTSLIPLTLYTVYVGNKLHTQKINPLVNSVCLVCVYLLSSVYVILKGPVYELDASVACVWLVVNAVSVFCFLFGYASLMLKFVMDSEHKLTQMANTDRLTGLSNRHYMMAYLKNLRQETLSGQWLAMADIDDFKKINDTYGHSCGDYVLIEIANAMQEVCQGCTVCRWGGEEFLIISDTGAAKPALLEQLRQKVQNTPFSYQGHDFAVTVTIGVSSYQPGQSLDGWVHDADNKLYEGKAAHKNRVIY